MYFLSPINNQADVTLNVSLSSLSLSPIPTHTSTPSSHPGTSHDWRRRCDAVNLYHTLFGLTRPSCLPLPELGLVLNLKEKKAVLNPTIKPEQGGAALPEVPGSAGLHGPPLAFTSSVSIPV